MLFPIFSLFLFVEAGCAQLEGIDGWTQAPHTARHTAVCNVQCAVCGVQCVVCIVHVAVCSCSVQYSGLACSVQCAVCSLQFAVCSLYSEMYNACKHAFFSVQFQRSPCAVNIGI